MSNVLLFKHFFFYIYKDFSSSYTMENKSNHIFHFRAIMLSNPDKKIKERPRPFQSKLNSI